MKRKLWAVAAVVLGVACVRGQAQDAAPSVNPVAGQVRAGEGGNGAPAGAVTLDANSDVNAVLDALHRRGVGLTDFTADVSLAEMDALTGDTTTNRGKVWYQARGEDNARLRVTFDERQVGKKVDRESKVEYLLDGPTLVELDHKRRLRVERQVLRPGEKMNLFELGKGPFPLPIGQPKEKVLEMFEVTKVAPKPDDPAGTVHVQLRPKEGTRFAKRFKTFDVWVDAKTNFPKKIETMDPNQTAVRSTEFNNIVVNGGVGNAQFDLGPTTGWEVKQEPLAD